MFEQDHVAFFTATIFGWKHLLKPDKYKRIILDSLQFLVENGRIRLYGFVIHTQPPALALEYAGTPSAGKRTKGFSQIHGATDKIRLAGTPSPGSGKVPDPSPIPAIPYMAAQYLVGLLYFRVNGEAETGLHP